MSGVLGQLQAPLGVFAVLGNHDWRLRGVPMRAALEAAGVPVLTNTARRLDGDEFGRSQGGNNNAYCQDSELNWFDWEGIGDDGQLLIEFTRRLIALRKAHPVLRRARFLHGNERSESGIEDITWISPAGTEKTAEQWADNHARCLGLMLNGKVGNYRSPEGQSADDDPLLIVMNAHHEVVPFTLPPITGGVGWRRLLDTTAPTLAEDQITHQTEQPFAMPGRALVLFACQPARGTALGCP